VIVLSLAIALALNSSQGRFFRALRSFYFVPAITAIVAVALVWGYLYNTQFGCSTTALARRAAAGSLALRPHGREVLRRAGRRMAASG
jgi:ABC-type sugar transport system permease subunit